MAERRRLPAYWFVNASIKTWKLSALPNPATISGWNFALISWTMRCEPNA
jgi:hypothetical protein